MYFRHMVAIMLALILFMGAAGGVVYYFFYRHDVIQQQLIAFQHNDIELAYSYTSHDFRRLTSLDEFKQFISHHPNLLNAVTIAYLNQHKDNKKSWISAKLKTSDNQQIVVEYSLIKENRQWKIQGITVKSEDKKLLPPQLNQPLILTNEVDNPLSRYSIKYPTSWEYEKENDSTLILGGKMGTKSYFSTINIQTVLTKNSGGEFVTVKKFIRDIKQQVRHQSPNVKFLEEGPIELTGKDGAKIHGEFVIFTFGYDKRTYKQWQIVVIRNDNQVFYAWGFTSRLDQFDNDLSIAKKMLASWVIY